MEKIGYVSPKHLYLSTSLHGVTFQKKNSVILTAVRTWNLTQYMPVWCEGIPVPTFRLSYVSFCVETIGQKCIRNFSRKVLEEQIIGICECSLYGRMAMKWILREWHVNVLSGFNGLWIWYSGKLLWTRWTHKLVTGCERDTVSGSQEWIMSE
jgi:hypothetical protein